MIFEDCACADGEGLILAHTLRAAAKTYNKGLHLSAQDIGELLAAGVARLSGLRMQAGDVSEDVAALELARLLAGKQLTIGRPVAGRCNLYAKSAGLALIDKPMVDAINRCDTGITVATLPEYGHCLTQQAVASIKVIPFALPREQLQRCTDLIPAGQVQVVVDTAPFRPFVAGLIVSVAAGQKSALAQSTIKVTEQRLMAMGASMLEPILCGHSVAQLEDAIRSVDLSQMNMLLICGASITVDPADIIPTAIRNCGGEIEHFGMPVEPGNMLLLARIGLCQVINLPGCSRSPKLNGLDWVMQRIAAGVGVDKSTILAMGVGGLLKDVSHRDRMRQQHSLRENLAPPPVVAALVLAAGRSSRMPDQHKLLAPVAGVAMVRRVVDAAISSEVSSVTVVTGHRGQEVEELLAERDIDLVRNHEYETGLASSLRLGLASLPSDIDGVIILLADMPFIRSNHLNELLAEFSPDTERDIVAPIRAGRLGNPVIWASRYFPAMMALTGDRGARGLLEESAAHVWEVPMGDDAIFQDVDTTADLAEANQIKGVSL